MLNQHIILGVGWIVFCLLHSVLADSNIKQKIEKAQPALYKYYRLFYVLFAFATLGAVLYFQINIPSPLLYRSSLLFTLMGGVLLFTGAVIMAICIRKYFINLSGLKSLYTDTPASNELRIDGIHRYVRHPLYLGTFIFIWGLWIVYPYLSLLIANGIITGYTLFAINLEEKKLEREFGNAYRHYKKTVPRLLPFVK